ncbi:MAG: RIP metalloprotease RseP [Deltaproteobacteria bacterium]|nr:RIP metalloprotease RseP [Deltaproteobacteria bacterium]
MISFVQSAAAVVFVLGLLIFFHELGHYAVARMLGVGVKCFSLGFGPRLLGWKRGMTDYRVSAVPLGGYVRLVGDEGPDEGYPDAASFALRPAWQRMAIVAAGPIFNFVLAWFIFWGIFWANGQAELVPRIGTVQEDSAAQRAGIEPGDLIVSIDGLSAPYWSDLLNHVQDSGGRTLMLELERGGQVMRVSVTPMMQDRKNIFGESKMIPMIGVTPSGEVVDIPLGLLASAEAGLVQTWMLIRLTVLGLVKLVQRVVPLDNVGGPIMIAQLVAEQVENGVIHLFSLAALISVNLGLLNLLPIPVLDGGHILFYAIEMIRGRPLNERMRQAAVRVGLAALVGLMVLATFNDILRTFR